MGTGIMRNVSNDRLLLIQYLEEATKFFRRCVPCNPFEKYNPLSLQKFLLNFELLCYQYLIVLLSTPLPIKVLTCKIQWAGNVKLNLQYKRFRLLRRYM